MNLCTNCSSVTDYVCLNCERAVCNRINECSVPVKEDIDTSEAETNSDNLYCILCSPKAKATEEVIMSLKPEDPAIAETTSSVKLQPSSSAKVKRERRSLTLGEKIEVIQISSEEGASTRKLAKRFGCGRTQIVTTLKEKEKILSMWTSSANGEKMPKKGRTEKYPEINGLLWKWYIRARESNIPINGPLLQEEARLIAAKLGDEKFRGSNGWLESWKQRHDITQMSFAAKKEVEIERSVESWHEQLQEITRGYSPEDVWSLDETGCFWKTAPTKGFHENSKICHKGQNAKGRITTAFLVNAVGEKETPIFIGSRRKPRCFAKLPDISRPCGAEYFSNDKAWMRTEILINVLCRLNDRMKDENRNILLFLNNASCHPPSLPGTFSNIDVVFYPRNMTSQPLQAGIVTMWKILYRQKLLRYLISQVNGNTTVSDVLKSVNLLTALRWMVSAWEEVTPEVITKCFKFVKMYPEVPEDLQSVEDPFPSEELLGLVTLAGKISEEQGIDVSSYANIDDDVLAAYQALDTSDPNWREEVRAEILKERTNDEEMVNESDKGSDEGENFDPPLQAPSVKSVKEAIGLANQLAQFADWQGDEKLSSAVLNVSQLLEEAQLKSLMHSP